VTPFLVPTILPWAHHISAALTLAVVFGVLEEL
jgi:hypothetical protein